MTRSRALIDNRIGSKELSPLLRIPHELARLEYGDVSFLGKYRDESVVSVGIERKTIMDLLSSMISGRLSGHQMVGLIKSYDQIYLLVEGIWRANPSNDILESMRAHRWDSISLGSRTFMASEMTNYLNSLSVICGVHVWFTSSIRGSAQWIDGIYSWWQKSWEQHKSHAQFHVMPEVVSLRKPNLVTRCAKELKGVGWEKSRDIAKQFKTMLDLACADEKDLQKIPGIGKILAKSIIKELRGE